MEKHSMLSRRAPRNRAELRRTAARDDVGPSSFHPGLKVTIMIDRKPRFGRIQRWGGTLGFYGVVDEPHGEIDWFLWADRGITWSTGWDRKVRKALLAGAALAAMGE